MQRSLISVLAVVATLSLLTGCGSSPESTGGRVSDQGMKEGCAAVHELFAALGGGDEAAAKGLVSDGKAKFDAVVKAAEGKDPQLASNATAMSDMLAFGLPEKPVEDSSLAQTYAVDCVRIYGAEAL